MLHFFASIFKMWVKKVNRHKGLIDLKRLIKPQLNDLFYFYLREDLMQTKM